MKNQNQECREVLLIRFMQSNNIAVVQTSLAKSLRGILHFVQNDKTD